MVKILGNVLKVNSIDVFPTTVGHDDSYLRVNNSESSYELVDTETVRQEAPINDDYWSSRYGSESLINVGINERCDESLRYSLNCIPAPSMIFSSMWTSNANQIYPFEIGSEGVYSKGIYVFEFSVLPNTSQMIQIHIEDNNGDRYLIQEFSTSGEEYFKTRSTYIGVDFKKWFIQVINGGNIASLGNIGMYKYNHTQTTIEFEEGWNIVFGNGIKKHFETLPSVEIIRESPYEDWYDLICSDYSFGEQHYNCFVREDGTTYVSTNDFVRSSVEPKNPTDDMRWIDTAQLPIRSYRWDNGWKRCSDVLLFSFSMIDQFDICYNICLEPDYYNGTHIYQHTYWYYESPLVKQGESVILSHNLNIQECERFKGIVEEDSSVKVWLGKNKLGFIAPQNGAYTVRIEVLS